jgi:spore coat polysaccharide biosynthesis protein SpsF
MDDVIAIVQARMGSTRLSGKVLLDLAGKPMLIRVIERINQSKHIDGVVIATTTNLIDNDIVSMCRDHGWNFYRGSEVDVLDRYYQTAKQYDAKTIVRITSDCPLIEPSVIDRVVRRYFAIFPDVDYVSNIFPYRTYPRGLDVEVMSFKTLERCWKEETTLKYREHVTLYIHHNPYKFKIDEVNIESDLSLMRWTVDTQKDFDFVSKIYNHFGEGRFSWVDVIELLKKYPEISEINKGVQQKAIR